MVGAGALAACRTSAPSAEPQSTARDVERVVAAQPTVEGAGVRLRRSLGSRALPLLDPFLMLDEFHSDDPDDYVKGFPDHPHRGFETVTYMLEGAMEHRDSLGNRGRLGPGSAQWMTAGRGIIHSEMPKQERGLMWGFQLWVNLAAKKKMSRPRYQDIAPERIPDATQDGALVRVVAGEALGKFGPVDGIDIAPQMLDVKLGAGARFRQPIPRAHNAFVYVFDGAAQIGPAKKRVAAGELAVLGPGDSFVATAESNARLLLLSGAPIGEPVARYGPFVMNTDDEIKRAIDDYRGGRLTDG